MGSTSTPEVVRVRRDTLAARVTCPLCKGLLREATTIPDCLHSFCWECIMKKIKDEDADCCPVCKILLSGDPENKLRPDHNLQDLRNKLFPTKRDSIKAPIAILPEKRKQRSLASMVVEKVTGRRTKPTRRTMALPTFPNENETMVLPTNSEDQDHPTTTQSEPQPPEVVAASNKNQQNKYIDTRNKPFGSVGTNSLLGEVTTPVWFSLVASPNQKEDSKLPQLSRSYLRIKDGCVQVSSIQKYIMTKLDLANADAVEITCHGVPISSSSTLNGLIEFCVRREQGEPIQASFDTPAKEFVMVLGYRRRQRASAP